VRFICDNEKGAPKGAPFLHNSAIFRAYCANERKKAKKLAF
jgi:hypothetical protein